VPHGQVVQPQAHPRLTSPRLAAPPRAGPGDAAAAGGALARFRLAALAETPCRYLSAGQKRRLNLARLLASPAPLWLLDEPSTGLDRESTGDLEAAIEEHRRGGGVVVVSTHVPLSLREPERLELGAYARARALAATGEIF
jgi:heme exporter protein A